MTSETFEFPKYTLTVRTLHDIIASNFSHDDWLEQAQQINDLPDSDNLESRDVQLPNHQFVKFFNFFASGPVGFKPTVRENNEIIFEVSQMKRVELTGDLEVDTVGIDPTRAILYQVYRSQTDGKTYARYGHTEYPVFNYNGR